MGPPPQMALISGEVAGLHTYKIFVLRREGVILFKGGLINDNLVNINFKIILCIEKSKERGDRGKKKQKR